MTLAIPTTDQPDPAESTRPVSLDKIACFGRTLDDYRRFFDFDPDALAGQAVLDVAAGSASFTAEAIRRGILATACDPNYRLSPDALRRTAELDFEHVRERAEAASGRFRFDGDFASFADLWKERRGALERFTDDYRPGRAAARYQSCALPRLPFRNRLFDLVLCGHFLFLYDDRLDYRFHFESCRELVRVTKTEARIYPLVGLGGEPFTRFERLLSDLRHCGIEAEVRPVNYQFLKGADHMLVLTSRYAQP